MLMNRAWVWLMTGPMCNGYGIAALFAGDFLGAQELSIGCLRFFFGLITLFSYRKPFFWTIMASFGDSRLLSANSEL